MNTSVRRIVGLCGLMGAVGCAAHQARQEPAAAETTSRRVVFVRTLMEDSAGNQRDVGVVPWSEATVRMVTLVPVRTVVLNPAGLPVGYEPAWTLAPGVEEPPADTKVEWIKLNRQGQLVDWKLAE